MILLQQNLINKLSYIKIRWEFGFYHVHILKQT